MQHETILVVDFSGHNSQLIARKVREEHIYCEVVPHAKALQRTKEVALKGIILAGGMQSVDAVGAALPSEALFNLGVPVLGIGYGAHAMLKNFGGTVEAAEDKAGIHDVAAKGGLILQHALAGEAWFAHPDRIAALPKGFAMTASTEVYPIAAAEDSIRNLYALQFEPEKVQTAFGKAFLGAFLKDTCGCAADWTPASFVQEAIETIVQTVGDKKVLCALSGGVDSTVCAVLTHRAIGDALTCVFVDHGLMRKNEGDEVMQTLTRELNIKVIRVNAQERFLSALAGVTDPETKRKIIGREFIEVFSQEAAKLGAMDYLLQGTIYPDVLESGVGDAAVVKSHHNVGGLPEKLGFLLLEPVRQLFKSEVREVGRELGIPDFLVDRQPFPGPGLGVRCLGEVTEEKLVILREADAILRDEFAKAGLNKTIWQYFAVLPGIRSVGMTTDGERTYSHAIGLRAVHSIDAMTADWARIPYDVLERISARILREVPHVNRILYDCTPKPPGTIEWE